LLSILAAGPGQTAETASSVVLVSIIFLSSSTFMAREMASS